MTTNATLSLPRAKEAARMAPSAKLSKPRRWSHQSELNNLIGKRIYICFDTESHVRGTLVNADQFTLCIANDDKYSTTYFKHAIRGYGLSEI